MSDIVWHDEAAKKVRILQFMVGAMLGGVLLLLLVVIGASPQFPIAAVQPISITSIAALLVGIGLIARFFFLRYMTSKARREVANGTYRPIDFRQWASPTAPSSAETNGGQSASAKYLLSAFQVRTIFSAAMFEGWAFFALIAYLVERAPVALGLVGLLMVGLAAHFSTPSRAIYWVERELSESEQVS